MESSQIFFREVIAGNVTILDIHNYIEYNTNNNLNKLEILKDDLEQFEINLVSDNIVGTLHGVRPNYRPHIISDLFHDFKNIVDQKIKLKIRPELDPRNTLENLFISPEKFEFFKEYATKYILDPYTDWSYLFQRMLKENYIRKAPHLKFARILFENEYINEKIYEIITDKESFKTLKKSYSVSRENNFNLVFQS